jgi:predicted CoA-binding protein
MNHDSCPDSTIRGILNTVKTIAMVGASQKDNRPSYFAFKYLLERVYNMIAVNPGQAGTAILGRNVYAKLADILEPVDMVDIFRASQYAPAIVQEALALILRPRVIWMQLGVRSDEAAALAEANGLKVVMNRCPKIEYGRPSSEIGWMGSIHAPSARRRPRSAASSACHSTASRWPAARPRRRSTPSGTKVDAELKIMRMATGFAS